MNKKEKITEIGSDAIKYMREAVQATEDSVQKETLLKMLKRVEDTNSGKGISVESTVIPTNSIRIVLQVSAPSDMTIGEILDEINELLMVANKTEGMNCKYKLDM